MQETDATMMTFATLEERTRGAHAQLVQLVVDRGLLFDVGVRRREIGFRQVVIVVADEVFDGVLRKEILEFVIELRSERLIVREDNRRAVRGGDHFGHRECLAGAGDAEQDLMLFADVNAVRKLGDGLRLVAAGLVVAGEFEIHWVAAQRVQSRANKHTIIAQFAKSFRATEGTKTGNRCRLLK